MCGQFLDNSVSRYDIVFVSNREGMQARRA